MKACVLIVLLILVVYSIFNGFFELLILVLAGSVSFFYKGENKTAGGGFSDSGGCNGDGC
ncbi:hypothetical protein H0A36_12845 [Endozoicomonas sp. SM1973]|uniref:Uncharacterized protein n=1 Tax=Spartinivicinus marinus TaxID=2994442 RepID=A0A853IAN1_9GAMM|nr:hypothetical protein [Spartinivicinus marinus]MCX4026529.1 hypothetical protein [Spartinivicinus marinus]NYZ66901.1 hypothetical protein [Spartinivicinus marinus]